MLLSRRFLLALASACLFVGTFSLLPAIVSAAPANTITISDKSGTASTNYPLQFGRPFIEGAIPNYPQVLINGVPANTQADVKNRYPDGSVEYAVIAIVIPSIPANGSLTLTFQNQSSGNNTPLTQAQMLDSSYSFDAHMALAFTSGTTGAADARTMLSNGDYKLWTSGQIAQTVEIADDTTARKYDLGNGDGYHPFRPRFYATFWPATNQVTVRYVGENGLTTELEDLAYNLTLTIGNTSPTTVFTFDLTGTQAYPKKHWSQSNWTETFWLGGTPPQQINIDNNLPYLSYTHFIPNFDPSITLSPTKMTSLYTNWTRATHTLYDGTINGGSSWTEAMPTTGGRSEIAPYPDWTVNWLYTGDWRMRQIALGMADIASAWSANLRESNPAKNLLRTDASGAGTGLGHVVAITNRPTISMELAFSGTKAADKVTVVGTIANPYSAPANPWVFDVAHEPNPFFPQYILTGDPYYLNEMYMWAGYSTLYGTVVSRGPTGAEGGIFVGNNLRGDAWILRSRAEVAFAAPDGAPEKSYFTTLINDALARWEGSFGITGTAFDGTTMKKWGADVGDSHTCDGSITSCQVPPLHNWQSVYDSAVLGQDATAYDTGLAGGFTSNWQQWFVQYALGRTAELGFAAGPLRDWTGQYPMSLINNSSSPWIMGLYHMPTERNAASGGGFFSTWADIAAMLQPWTIGTTTQGTKITQSESYPGYLLSGVSYLTDANTSGAASAWNWMKTNVWSAALPAYPSDPRWDIVPRTDTSYSLPATSTAVAPSPLLTGVQAYLTPAEVLRMNLGQSLTLFWSSFNANSCTGHNFDTGGLTSGSVTVSPATTTTTYSITCTGSAGSATAQSIVRLSTGSVSSTPSSVSATLSASPASISTGGSSTLSWSSTNATSCVGSGFAASATSGSIAVTPAVTTTYSITCTGSTGSATKSVTVTVGSPAPTASLSASSISITSGQSSTLTWSSTNATSCAGTNFSTGSVVSGSLSVTPTTTTAYTVKCTGSGGSASASATIAVSTVTTANATFAVGTRVVTTNNLNVRSKGNLKSGQLVCVQPTGALGSIVGGPGTSQGYVWWNVKFDTGCSGWVVQTYLSIVQSAKAPITHALAKGWTGQEVTVLQSALSLLGFFKHTATGYFGSITETAVKDFQTVHNLAAVGIVGPKTRALLHLLGF